MKLILLNILKKQAKALIILIGLFLFIWFAGPFLPIAHHLPLINPTKRLDLITAIFLLWILKINYLNSEPQEKNKTKLTELPADIRNKLQTLQGRFQGALNFLNKTMLTKQGAKINLADLPWYLLLGPTDAGKTAFLANSKVNFILSKQFKAETAIVPTSDACDWWVTSDLVFIDVPGFYFANKEKTKYANVLWQKLLNLIQNLPVKEKLAGVIIALNLPEIMKKTGSHESNILIHDLKKRMTELRQHFGPQLSFHFVITKCDLLPGFLDFFNETASDELSQVWGVTIPSLDSKAQWLDVFVARFNALIKRINKQLLLRLHQERNPQVRPAIKDFPLHLERLKESITALFKALAMPDLQLQGVYLTSATQTPGENPFGYTHQSPRHLTHQVLQIMHTPALATRAYFVKQLIASSLLRQADSIEKQINYRWGVRAMYATSVGTIVAATLFLAHDFQQGREKTYALQKAINQYQTDIQSNTQNNLDNNHLTKSLVKALPLMNALAQAAQENHALTGMQNILAFYSHKSQETANSIYIKALQTIMIPEVKNNLEKYLSTANNKNPVSVYTALKAYLMLNDSNHFQASFVANTILPMNKQDKLALANHLNYFYSQLAPRIALDQNLIMNVRKQLINLPSAELGFVILNNMGTNNADSTLDLGTNLGSPPIFVSPQISNHIPNMYIASYFQKIMSEQINLASVEALKGNWVLGKILPSGNQPPEDALVAELRNEYTAKYVDLWESQIANIKPFKPKSLLQADGMIQNLTSNHSPFLQLLQTIRDNTAFDPIASASPKMIALDNLVNNSDMKQSALYEVFVNLGELHLYLQKILNSPNPNKYAFMEAAIRMQNPADNPITTLHELAEKHPEPLKAWLNMMADQSWHLMLEKAGEYAANNWQSDVLPLYNQTIAKRYPFVRNSNQDVDLLQFTHFLGHRGTLANFYLNYLKPFVNETSDPWTWRVVDNQHIPFANNLLANLQQAAQLQKVFFPNENNKLAIEFTMQPIFLDPAIRTLTLNINGQQTAFQKNGKRLPQTFTWPGNYYAHETTLSFITPQSKMISHTLKGDWGLFRLINLSTESVNDKKGMVLNLAAQGHSAKYILYTSAGLNPFLPESLAHFELPQDILQS